MKSWDLISYKLIDKIFDDANRRLK
jgi:hypothetical protein